ncbi:TolQ-related transport transmembrane protein [gamma proteobacterium HdN1]|nr:TolQ-related transport transmembrane protein [gamma proteobacterium HdN1]
MTLSHSFLISITPPAHWRPDLVQHSMSFTSLVLNATWVVQLVMLVLLGLSISSWYIIWQRRSLLGESRRAAENFEERFWSGIDLSRLFVQVNNEPDHYSGHEAIFRAGFKEFARLRKVGNAEPDSIMAGAERAMKVALLKEQERLEANLSFLATVGSVSPYIGLFGTVWGIMHAFINLANQNQATLSAVAPGIAEALIATAIGLVAAIPAVVAFNRYTSLCERLLHNYETFADEFSGILHRKAHSKEAD